MQYPQMLWSPQKKRTTYGQANSLKINAMVCLPRTQILIFHGGWRRGVQFKSKPRDIRGGSVPDTNACRSLAYLLQLRSAMVFSHKPLAASWGPNRVPDTKAIEEMDPFLDPFSCSSPSNSPPCIYTQGSPASPPWTPPLLPARSPTFFFFLFSHCLPQVKTVPELNQNIKVTNNFRLIFQYHHWP